MLSFSRMCLHDVLCHLTGPRGLYTLIKLTKGEPALRFYQPFTVLFNKTNLYGLCILDWYIFMNFPRDTEHYCVVVSTNNAVVGHIISYS